MAPILDPSRGRTRPELSTARGAVLELSLCAAAIGGPLMGTGTNPSQQQRLLEMDPIAVVQDGAREQWEAIPDLDVFLERVYEYFRARGLRCILASRIISLLTLAFTIVRQRLTITQRAHMHMSR